MNTKLALFKKLTSWLANIGLVLATVWLIQWFQSSHLHRDGTVLVDKQLALPQLTQQLNNSLTNQSPQVLTELFRPEQLLGKPTLLYFFAPWCHICHLSIDNVEDLAQQKSGQVNVVAIALSYETLEEVTDFVKQHQLTIPVLLGGQHTLTAFRIQGFPSYYITDESGVVVAAEQGYSTELGMLLRL